MAVFPLVILIFVLVMFAGVIIVGGWLVLSVFRFFTRVLFGPNHNRVIPRHEFEARRSSIQCTRPQCRTVNAAHARFCRRCGESLAARDEYPRSVA